MSTTVESRHHRLTLNVITRNPDDALAELVMGFPMAMNLRPSATGVHEDIATLVVHFEADTRSQAVEAVTDAVSFLSSTPHDNVRLYVREGNKWVQVEELVSA